MVPRLSSQQFDWQRWRAASLADFNIPCRRVAITDKQNSAILRESAVGYCEAGLLSVRPKPGQYAVMFFINGEHFWTHFTKEEFDEVFLDEA